MREREEGGREGEKEGREKGREGEEGGGIRYSQRSNPKLKLHCVTRAEESSSSCTAHSPSFLI